jgi:hypothetical protein
MLTLFSTPKPFVDPHIALIQRNALASWKALGKAKGIEIEILIVGDDEGVAKAAEDIGARHIPRVATNELGTPLVSAMFQRAAEEANHALLAYVNADIILFPGFVDALHAVQSRFGNFLAVGHRWDLDVTEKVDFDDAAALRAFQKRADTDAEKKEPWAIDFFVFKKGLWPKIPDFAVGRFAWDNWLIYGAIQERADVVDLTDVAMAVHQNHDYRHVKTEKPGEKKEDPYTWDETKNNTRLAGQAALNYNIDDAAWRINLDHTFRPVIGPKRVKHELERIQTRIPATGPVIQGIKSIYARGRAALAENGNEDQNKETP